MAENPIQCAVNRLPLWNQNDRTSPFLKRGRNVSQSELVLLDVFHHI